MFDDPAGFPSTEGAGDDEGPPVGEAPEEGQLTAEEWDALVASATSAAASRPPRRSNGRHVSSGTGDRPDPDETASPTG